MPARTHTPQEEKASQYLLEFMTLESQVDLKNMVAEYSSSTEYSSLWSSTIPFYYQVVGYSEQDSIAEEKLMLQLVKVHMVSGSGGPRLIAERNIEVVTSLEYIQFVTKGTYFSKQKRRNAMNADEFCLVDTPVCKKVKTKATYNDLHKSYNNKINTKLNYLKRR